MKNISDRLSNLSPDKQALLRRMLLKKKVVGDSDQKSEIIAPINERRSTDDRQVTHPLYDKCIIDGSGREAYITHFKVNKDWVLDEHRVMGKATLPGTAYMEMAVAAFKNCAGIKRMEIRNLYVLAPLAVGENEEKEVRTTLQKLEDRFMFSVISQPVFGEDKWQEHARGEIRPVASESMERHEIREIEAECDEQEIIVTEDDLKLRSEIIAFGPRWNNFHWIKLGSNQGLACLELPKAFLSDMEDYHLHPALLDNAIGFLGDKFRTGDYFPFYYKSLRIRDRMPRKVYSHIKYIGNSDSRKEVLKFSIKVMDEQGTEIVDIEEYTLRRANLKLNP